MKRLVGIQGPPRSTPGNPPHMETRSLHSSITFSAAKPSDLIAAAGVAAGMANVKTGADVNEYALHLEFGTMKMRPRPWILRSLVESRGVILGAFTETFAKTLGGGVTGVK